MRPLPDLNITALAGGRGYNGEKSGRFAASKRGFAPPTPDYYWVTVPTDVDAVIVKKGCLINWVYDLSTPGTAHVLQTVQTDWGMSGVTGVSEDIPVTGLSDGDTLWVEIHLLMTDTDFPTGTASGHDHTVSTTFGDVQGGASIPFINFGASLTMTDDVVKIPFAQFVGGKVVQLHVGVMVCPPFFTLVGI